MRDIDMPQIKLGYKNTPATEQEYTRIVSSLFMLRERNGLSSFVFTGCEHKVGNTTVCLNIAAELAKAEKKTLLVDCDFQKQADEKRLYQYVDAGLAEYLSSDISLDDITYETNVPTLSYISSGKHFTNPTMMLWSEKFADFIINVTNNFDFVIFDTAPVLSAPETSVLAYRAAATILTVRFGRSLKAQVYASKKELDKNDSNFLGAIVNKTPVSECRIYHKTHGFSVVLRGPSVNSEDKRLPPML